MSKFSTLAKPQDLSVGFKDFFDTIGLTGGGLVVKGIVAVLAVIAVRMLLQAAGDPKLALRKGGMGVGVLVVALALALYGGDLFATIGSNGKAG